MQNKLKLAIILGAAAGGLTLHPPEASGSCFYCCHGWYTGCNFCGCLEGTPDGHDQCVPSSGCESWCGGCNSQCGGQPSPCEIR
jgi:hypothetical protein